MAEEKINNPEEVAQSQATEEQSDAGTEQMPKFKSLAEKKKYIHDLKKQKETERKAQLKKDREEAKQKAREEQKLNGGSTSKKGLWIALALLLAVCIGAGIFFVLPHKKVEPIVEPEIIIDSIIEPEVIAPPVIEKVVEVQPSNKWGINTPCFVISHSSMKSEKFAQKTVSKLQSAGFKTGYYWIPDLTPAGNAYYKVFVGPFGSEQAAIDKLSEVRKYSKLSYIIELK